MTATIHHLADYRRPAKPRVAHAWRPQKGEIVGYFGQPARVLHIGEQSCQVEKLHPLGHVHTPWVGTAILRPWKGDDLDAVYRVMAGERPCDTEGAA